MSAMQSNRIDERLVRHIGRLSRIALTDEEARTLAPQLEAILSYFDKLQELDTSAVQPMVHAEETYSVLADDVPGESLATEAALANAPRRDGDYFQVPKVIEDS
jgi:aspartyl/glutamyl-tRNA(Asn/Gln) amidotransferase C subunit